MKVMQFKTLTGQKVLDLQGHNGDVAALSLNPKDVNTFITGSVDRTARMWDLRTPGCVQTFWGHKADVNSVSVHPSGVSFVTCSEDKTVSQHQIIYTYSSVCTCVRPPKCVPYLIMHFVTIRGETVGHQGGSGGVSVQAAHP